MAIFDENMAVGKSENLVMLHVCKLETDHATFLLGGTLILYKQMLTKKHKKNMAKPHFTKLRKMVISKHILTSPNKKTHTNSTQSKKLKRERCGQCSKTNKPHTKHLTTTVNKAYPKQKTSHFLSPLYSVFSSSNFSQFLY